LKPASDKPLPIGESVLFGRVAPGEPHFRPGIVSVSAYITFDHARSGESAGEIEPGYALIGEGNMTTLPVESRATIEVIAGRRTHLRITPPADLEKTLREDIGKALGDETKLAAEIRKARPVKLEVVGQQGLVPEDHLRDQAASVSTQRFSGGFAN
jgi:hypothetical protein